MILYISDKELLKNTAIHIITALFTALFGAVYEHFSHEVYSYYMIYAFAFPLAMGAFPYIVMILKRKHPSVTAVSLWNSSIAAFTVGCIFKGVLDIYGTTNRLIIVYPATGIILGIAAVVFCIIKRSDNAA